MEIAAEHAFVGMRCNAITIALTHAREAPNAKSECLFCSVSWESCKNFEGDVGRVEISP